MNEREYSESGVVARVVEQLPSGESRTLFAALLEAQRRAGAKGVKDLMNSVLAEARQLRLEDAEGDEGE